MDVSQGLAHMSRLLDKQRASEQTIINSNTKNGHRHENREQARACLYPHCLPQHQITPLMVPCGGKAIFSKFIVYLNRGLFI